MPEKGSVTLAAIDAGTNSFHLIVARIDRRTGRFTILDREKEIVRLGSGSSDMKYLSEEAMARGIGALRRFASVAAAAGAPVTAIATSAVREALNQDEFIRRVRTETGISLRVAPAVEEARLIYLGVLQALPLFDKKILLIDIGGGSTEFLVGRRLAISFNNSLKLGAVRLTQQFFPEGKISPKAVKECRKYIRGMMAPITRQLKRRGIETVVGSSGTIMNLFSIIRAGRGRKNGPAFTARELADAVERITDSRTLKERLAIRGLDPARADIIAAGALILDEIFRQLGISKLTVSEFALREGIIFDAFEKLYPRPGGKRLHNIRLASVLHLASTLHYEEGHSRHVAALALAIFDQTARIHRLGAREREYLEAAAILHEVGLFVSHAQHHRHSYYLIRNAELPGYTENEKEIIANVARYHRKSHPKYKHEGFRRLSAEEQEVVTKLAAILRIADGLDRTHREAVPGLRCSRKKRTLTIHLRRARKRPVEMEIWGAERKKKLFEETFKTKLRILAGKK